MKIYKLPYRFTFLIVVFILLSNHVKAQQFSSKTDSLKSPLESSQTILEKAELQNQLSQKYFSSNPDTGIYWANLALKNAKEIQSKKMMAAALRNLAINYMYLNKKDTGYIFLKKSHTLYLELGDKKDLSKSYKNWGFYFDAVSQYDSAMFYYKKSHRIDIELNDSIGKADCLLNLGVLNLRRNNTDVSFTYFLEALNLYEKQKNTGKIAYCYNVISLIYRKTNKYDEAIEYGKKSVEINKKTGNKNATAQALINIGVNYKSKGEFDKAIIYHKKGLKIAEEISSKWLKASAYTNLANVYMETEKHEKALKYHFKSLEINTEIGNQREITIATANIGETYSSLGKHQMAKKYSLEGLALSKTLSSGELLLNVYPSTIKVYQKAKDFEVAYKLLSEYKTLSDSILSEKKMKNIQNLQIEFETEKKNQQISFLKEKRKFHESNENRNYWIAVLAISLMLIFASFLILLYFNRKKISIQKKELEETHLKLKELINFKETLTNTIVHDLKNPLSLVLDISQQGHTKFNFEKIRNYALQMHHLVLTIMDSFKYTDSKMLINRQFCNLHEVINKARLEVNYFAEKKNISVQTNCKNNYLIEFDEHIVLRMLNNILFNAIKYTPSNGQIEINIEFIEENLTKIEIKDSGDGIDERIIGKVFDKYFQDVNKKSTYSFGIGLTFCKLAVNAHEGKLGVRNNIDKGSTFWFTLKGKRKSIENIEQKSIENQAKEILLDNEDEKYLKIYKEKLKEIDIFEISMLREILQSIDSDKNSIKKWKKELDNAIMYHNKDYFQILIN